jgi:hypothetical protein
MQTITLENEALRLAFNSENGALIGLLALESGWPIIKRANLGLSFRLLLPLPDRRNNPVFGEKQKVSRVERASNSVTFTWDQVSSEYGGTHDLKITLNVTLKQRQAVFTLGLENNTEFTVENVYCPYFGEVRRPDAEAWFKTFSYSYASAQEWSLWPNYQNTRGYYGIDFPVQYASDSHTVGAPMAPFILLRGAKQGLYIGVSAPETELVAWNTELRPGYDNSITTRISANMHQLNWRVPDDDTISGKDVAIRFAAVHLPYILPGEKRTLTPVMVEPYGGDWQHGVDIYKAWRDQWMPMPKIPAWAREPHAWQQLHINSPENELRMPFRDLPQIGEECARHGVKAIQLVGWNHGGQDQFNPSHIPDPQLGTKEELKEAIARIQAMGVKVVLFAKFTWADRATERFRTNLIRQAIKDPYGDYYHYVGYQYQTATQLLDINTKRLIPMCFLSEEYLRICEMEFQQCLELGADGILFDECLHHSPTLLCFDPDHGHRHGAMVYANDNELIRRFARLSEQANPDYLFAGEACYDWEFQTYQLSYHRSERVAHVALSRYMLPFAPLMTAVTGFNDRNMINQCLMYRYIISYEPYNFKGRLEDYPLTLSYGKQMDSLRRDLREILWDGEFRDKVGAEVLVDGQPHHPYAVFENHTTGHTGVVIVNYDESAAITAHLTMDSGKALGRYRLVDNPEWHAAAEGIVIPPHSAAVVVE